MAVTMTRAELAEAYSDPIWRTKLLDALDLLSILLNCIIRKNYRPSEKLNRTIAAALTVQGKKVRDQLVTKEKVNPKDANILTFSGFLHVEPLIDLDILDFDKFASSISDEIRETDLRFPMIFGRGLYDRAISLFPEERDYLKHDDTLKLLADSPQGVFQSGRYLIGPYGIITVAHPRALRPRTRIPLQHCADLSCFRVHQVQLSTSYEAGVNAGRRALTTVLDSIAPEPSEWNGFISDILEETINPYSLDASESIPFLLGDGFSGEELKNILRNSKQHTNGRTFSQARALGAITDGDFAENLSREQVLQILLTESDESLTNLTDTLILDGTICIPAGEIRRPVINHAASSGVWHMRAEASSLGVRGVSGSSRFVVNVLL